MENLSYEITNKNQQKTRATLGKPVVQIGKYKINRVKHQP